MLTVKEAAALAGCSRQRIAKLIKQGRIAGALLTATAIGPYWLVPESEARRWAAAAPVRGKGGRPRKAGDAGAVRLCFSCHAALTRADEQAGRCPACGIFVPGTPAEAL